MSGEGTGTICESERVQRLRLKCQRQMQDLNKHDVDPWDLSLQKGEGWRKEECSPKQ